MIPVSMVLATLFWAHIAAMQEGSGLKAPKVVFAGEPFSVSAPGYGREITALKALKKAPPSPIPSPFLLSATPGQPNVFRFPVGLTPGEYTISIVGAANLRAIVKILKAGGNDPILRSDPTVSGGLTVSGNVQDETLYSDMRLVLVRDSAPPVVTPVQMVHPPIYQSLSAAASQSVAEAVEPVHPLGPTFYYSYKFAFSSLGSAPYMYVRIDGIRKNGFGSWEEIGRSQTVGPLKP